MNPPGLQPLCSRCRHRHRPSLPCWNGRLVPRARAAVFARYGDVCHICGGPGADTVDHLTSRALGGTDTLENMLPAHRFCNTGRGARPLEGRALAQTTEGNPRW